MPMATEHAQRLSRRAALCSGAVALTFLCGNALGARPLHQPRLATAWDDAQGHWVGVLVPENSKQLRRPDAGEALSSRAQGALSIAARTEVPTRAHGLLAEPDGHVLVVARRPGDWLLRWHPRRGTTQWAWSEAGRSFNGHVVASLPSSRRRWLFKTETDLHSGMGWVGVRDARSLEKLHEWPTRGMDPHELLLDDTGLWVANGGIPTLAETGRIKRDLHRMDSSLVRLDPSTGEVLGQWRLPDARLSLRHIARAAGGVMGIALQAEHDDLQVRRIAPVLAVFDGHALHAVPLPEGVSLQGYAGDIAALPRGEGFLMSAPRANCVAHWHASLGWQANQALNQACALIAPVIDEPGWALGGSAAVSFRFVADRGETHWRLPLSPHIRPDNHGVSVRRAL